MIYTPPIQQSDWSECYNHGIINFYHMVARMRMRGCYTKAPKLLISAFLCANEQKIMAFITLRVSVLLVFSIGLQHTAWSQSSSGDTDCPTPINSAGGRDVRFNQCPASNFRVFTGPDLQDLAERLPPFSPEGLAFAARTRESHVVRLTRSAQLGIAQEGARIDIDCLPWLSRFPGGSIRWKYIQLDEFGNRLGESIS